MAWGPIKFCGHGQGSQRIGQLHLPTLYSLCALVPELSIKVGDPRAGSHKSWGPLPTPKFSNYSGWWPRAARTPARR